MSTDSIVTRIVMDIDVPVGVPEPHYKKGLVYDSRCPEPYFVPPHKIEEFIARGFAHEQTWDEWFGCMAKTRKENIAACSDPLRKAELVAADNSANYHDRLFKALNQIQGLA